MVVTMLGMAMGSDDGRLDRRSSDRNVARGLRGLILAVAALLFVHPAHAQGFAIGQKVLCDASDLNKFYKPGVIIPFNPGETLNGNAADSGYFYRVRFDDPAFGESPCKVTSLHPAAPTRPAAAMVRPAGGGDRLFGARPPVSCPPPIRTRPTPAQIRALVQCRLEGARSSLMYFAVNLTIEAGAMRPYNYNADSYNSTIDPAAPVLPLRGSFIRYQCSPVSENPPGRNCTTDPEMHARGECYRTTFGNWECTLQGDDNDLSLQKFHQPPPR